MLREIIPNNILSLVNEINVKRKWTKYEIIFLTKSILITQRYREPPTVENIEDIESPFIRKLTKDKIPSNIYLFSNF